MCPSPSLPQYTYSRCRRWTCVTRQALALLWVAGEREMDFKVDGVDGLIFRVEADAAA